MIVKKCYQLIDMDIKNKCLTSRTEIRVRFSEVDSMKVVWHGHYLKYFEDGREAFGHEFNISYLDFFNNDIVVPLVHIDVKYKRFLHNGELAIVETKYVKNKAAKLVFNYIIYRVSNNEIIATGSSTQVFLDKNGDLMLNDPSFYKNWKMKWGIE